MPNKEEILEKHLPTPHLAPEAYSIYEAMGEYAKQFGESLIRWLNDNDFKPTNFSENMQSDHVNNGIRMHASEIVDLFIEQQNENK